jgi:hypothetical protein
VITAACDDHSVLGHHTAASRAATPMMAIREIARWLGRSPATICRKPAAQLRTARRRRLHSDLATSRVLDNLHEVESPAAHEGCYG